MLIWLKNQSKVQYRTFQLRYCHSRDCQLTHGAVFAHVVYWNPDDFRPLKTRSTKPVDQSSASLGHPSWERLVTEARPASVTYCTECGTQLYGKNRFGLITTYANQFMINGQVPKELVATEHVMYDQRIVDMCCGDSLPKYNDFSSRFELS